MSDSGDIRAQLALPGVDLAAAHSAMQ